MLNKKIFNEESPLTDYALRLKTLNERGYLEGRLFYPCLGVDFLPAIFTAVWSMNFMTGLINEESLEKTLYQARATYAFPITKQQLKLSLFEKNMWSTAYPIDFLKDQNFDCLYLKGLSVWPKQYTRLNREVQTEKLNAFIEYCFNQLLKPRSTVLIGHAADENYFKDHLAKNHFHLVYSEGDFRKPEFEIINYEETQMYLPSEAIKVYQRS